MFKINKIQTLLVLIFSMILTINAAAKTGRDNSYGIVVKALSQKLQNDLATAKVNLKLNQVSRYNISKTEVGIKGNASANDLPINFDVKINTVKAVTTNVEYNFIEAENSAASLEESAAGEALTNSILSKLKLDYKTANIVIALDETNSPTTENGKNIYKGSGDVRIGFDWEKIDFTVALDAKTNKAMDVEYEVQQQ